MKILFITEDYPYPLDTGGKIVTNQFLEALSSKHTVTLITRPGKLPTKKDINFYKRKGMDLKYVVYNKTPDQVRREIFKSYLNLKPPMLSDFYEEDLIKIVNKSIKKNNYDAIFIDHVYMAQYLPKVKNEKWFLCEHNMEYKILYDFFKILPTRKKDRIYHLYSAITLFFFEWLSLRKFDKIFVLSETDRKNAVKIGINKSKVVTTFPWQKLRTLHKTSQSKELLFIGNMWWDPNYDAMLWFIRNVFPIIQRSIPNIKLTIVGSDSSRLEFVVADQKNINLIPKVKDISPYLKRANAFILPFRIGEGVRLKALTAFSSSLPVVSTTKGMQGLNVENNKEFLKADTDKDFANKIIKLFKDKKLQMKLVKNARTYLKSNHNPRMIRNKILTEIGN